MALRATLKLDGIEIPYEVIECEYEFNQQIDANGKPCAKPRGGIIHFTITTPKASDTTFIEWMLNPVETKQGIFEFDLMVEAKSDRKVLVFQYAYCVHLQEYFNSQNNKQMLTKITLSAAILSFGKKGTVYSNNELMSAQVEK